MRNCDRWMTPGEAAVMFKAWCERHATCEHCPLFDPRHPDRECSIAWCYRDINAGTRRRAEDVGE